MSVGMSGPAVRASRETAVPGSVAGAIIETAHTRPGSPAVSDESGTITYGQLLDRALGIAAGLADLAGPHDAPVAVRLPRGMDLVVAAVGVLISGRPYLLVDPEQPPERAGHMLADSRACAVIGTPGDVPVPPAVPVIGFADLPAGPVDGRPWAEGSCDLAYVCYTSGSTGLAKGVRITRDGLARLQRWYSQQYATSAADRFSQVASASFDAWALEVWPCLSAGACLHVAPPTALLSAEALVEWLVSRHITVCFLPTPLAVDVLQGAWPLRADGTCAMRTMLVGGDRLAQPPAARPPFRLFNNYGPTECTVVATCGEITEFATSDPPPVGRPLPYVQATVRRPDGTHCETGEPGELYLSGPAVSPGYVGAGSDEGRFFADPSAGHTYRTGDVVAWGEDGVLHFAGRLDDQLSINGVRIEPAEVEAALLRCSGVRSAVAVRRRPSPAGNGGERLVAYVVGDIDQGRLRAEVTERLPRAMVPSAFVVVDALPRTPNGKVDRAALARHVPVPAATSAESRLPEPASGDGTAAILRGLWCDVLQLGQVGSDDDFFELGGDSLRVLRLVSKARKRGLQLTPDDIFRYPTFGALAAHTTDRGGEG
ncbi:MAG TPA: non-ribosomal peptide synthetase [Streptosporangiaceae bacterium]|nr:non-ribosomal peptide synthetase [Streptosporangiaceae bacterium]